MEPQRRWWRELPDGKRISALGFGCSSLWARPRFADAEAARILDTLWAEEVNHFDTGPSYGDGLGERRLGAWLRDKPLGELVVSTKVGTNLAGGAVARGFDPAAMEASFRGSLERLGVRRVDILYLHGPAADDLTTEVFAWFDRLKRDGLIGLSGVNSFDNRVLEATAASPLDAVMLQYNAGDLRNARAIETLAAAGKTVISGTALARGQFDPARFVPTSRAQAWYLARLLRRDPLFVFKGLALRRRLAATGRPPAEAAIQFAAGHPLILSNLFGTSSVEHARTNARAGHGFLDNEQWTRLASCA
jgi:aryl-alcohol dehydrogenase-like predicted oxidoreductase